METRIKKTGEIVNLPSYTTITLEQCDSWGNPIEVKPDFPKKNHTISYRTLTIEVK